MRADAAALPPPPGTQDCAARSVWAVTVREESTGERKKALAARDSNSLRLLSIGFLAGWVCCFPFRFLFLECKYRLGSLDDILLGHSRRESSMGVTSRRGKMHNDTGYLRIRNPFTLCPSQIPDVHHLYPRYLQNAHLRRANTSGIEQVQHPG